MLKCKLCGKEFHQLGNHLWHTHAIGKNQYEALFGYNQQFISDELKAKYQKSAQEHREQMMENLNKSSRKQGK